MTTYTALAPWNNISVAFPARKPVVRMICEVLPSASLTKMPLIDGWVCVVCVCSVYMHVHACVWHVYGYVVSADCALIVIGCGSKDESSLSVTMHTHTHIYTHSELIMLTN